MNRQNKPTIHFHLVLTLTLHKWLTIGEFDICGLSSCAHALHFKVGDHCIGYFFGNLFCTLLMFQDSSYNKLHIKKFIYCRQFVSWHSCVAIKGFKIWFSHSNN